MKNENYGASIECGVVESIENGAYRVASYTRDGAQSRPIKPINITDIFQKGDKVYFFMFDNGNGMIISKL